MRPSAFLPSKFLETLAPEICQLPTANYFTRAGLCPLPFCTLNLYSSRAGNLPTANFEAKVRNG